jgi:RNA polymerase sigma-70 factor (ECF subfamily)
MTDRSPTEKLLETSARWRGSNAEIATERAASPPPADRPAPLDEDEFRRSGRGQHSRAALVRPRPVRRHGQGRRPGPGRAAEGLAAPGPVHPGTNFKGWILKIARNHFYSQRRRVWRETPLDVAMSAQIPAVGTDQVQSLMLNDLRNALNALSDEQREATILVGAGGFSHRQAAEMCDVPEGTMKSRVCRARAKLAALLEQRRGEP